MPASLTESGFVPPELNTKEKAASPLVKELEPNGLVRVRTLLLTTQEVGLKVANDLDESVQADVATIVMDEGKVITILELVGMLCVGYRLNLYVLKS